MNELLPEAHGEKASKRRQEDGNFGQPAHPWIAAASSFPIVSRSRQILRKGIHPPPRPRNPELTRSGRAPSRPGREEIGHDPGRLHGIADRQRRHILRKAGDAGMHALADQKLRAADQAPCNPSRYRGRRRTCNCSDAADLLKQALDDAGVVVLEIGILHVRHQQDVLAGVAVSRVRIAFTQASS